MSFSRQKTDMKSPTEFLKKSQGRQAFNEGKFTPKFSSSSSDDDVKPFEHEDTYKSSTIIEAHPQNPLFKPKTKTGGKRGGKRSGKRRKTHKKKRNSLSRR